MKFNKDFFKTRKEDGRIIFPLKRGRGALLWKTLVVAEGYMAGRYHVLTLKLVSAIFYQISIFLSK